MKKIFLIVFLIFLIVFFFVMFFLDMSVEEPYLEWYSSNGCKYQLLRMPEHLINPNTQKASWKIQLFRENNNIYSYNFFNTGSLEVRCPSRTSFCDKTDSIYKRIWTYFSENGGSCQDFSLYKIWTGIVFSAPFEKTWGNNNVIVGCDFVEKKIEDGHDASGLFVLNKEGSCPIWLKLKEGLIEYALYSLNIEKEDSIFHIKRGRHVIVYPNRNYYPSPYPFAIKPCKSSTCDVISIVPDSNRKWRFVLRKNLDDIKVKCDYMHLKSSPNENITATLELKSESVCPIEITQEEGKIDTVYVRSIKAADGYEALMSTRESYEKELKKYKR